jgi:CPA2 family monovalent cation:H+ antiporter-2
MPAEHAVDLLTDLALILCVAAVTTTVFQRLRQPVVLGYLLAGVVVGPHLPVPLFVNEGLTHTLSELGVVLLMFSLGLDFSLRKLIKVAPTAGIVAGHPVQLHALGRLPGRPAVRLDGLRGAVRRRGAVDLQHHHHRQGVRRREDQGPLAEIVFGVLIVEDLIAIV